MNWKKLAVIAGVILVIWLVVSNPHGAAGGVHHGLDFLKSGANSIFTFVQNVFS